MRHRLYLAIVVAGLATILPMCLVLAAWAADLKEGIEQLAGTLAKSVPEQKQLRIAVSDFPDLQGVTSDLGRHIAERLTTRLSQTPKFLVIERRRLAQVLGELKFSMSDLVDPAKAKQLGKMLGVEAIVAGSISDLGNVVDVDARLIEVETNQMFPGASTSISKDQVVATLMGTGKTAGPGAGPPVTGTTPAGFAAASKIAPVRKELAFIFNNPVGRDWRVILDSVELVGGQALKFNFTLRSQTQAPLEVKLEQPGENTLVTDRAGRQYPMTEFMGVGGDRWISLPGGGQKKFSLKFNINPDAAPFLFESMLVGRDPERRFGESRVRLEFRDLKLSDFE